MRPTMRQSLTTLAVVAVVTLVAVGVASAQGILSTRHNLSTTEGTPARVGDVRVTTGTSEVCVFCHTPHGADTAVAAPLWNRAVNTSGGYTMYTSPTYNATTEAQPVGVSLACLSCHDGTIALDALRNQPGSGGFSESPISAGYTFLAAGAGNTMPLGRVTNLGTDLTNDHPISMTYTTALSPSATSGTNDHATGFYSPDGSGLFANGVRLYSGRVECASCHDPHRSDTPTFLRVSNAGSALCLTCHRKNG